MPLNSNRRQYKFQQFQLEETLFIRLKVCVIIINFHCFYENDNEQPVSCFSNRSIALSSKGIYPTISTFKHLLK